MTAAIVDHLKKAPVFYPGEEFTEEVYKEFFLDEETQLHAAFDADNKMIGLIETNQEADSLISEGAKSVFLESPSFLITNRASFVLVFQ